MPRRNLISSAENTLELNYLYLREVVTDRLVTSKCPDRDSVGKGRDSSQQTM